MVKITIGDYPPEYKPEVHGPYDPGRYYGKPDTPFGQVKLSELGAWFSRRNKSPMAIIHAIGRAHCRWRQQYAMVKRPSGVYLMQITVWGMITYYYANFGKKLVHRHVKYH